jgi:type I restriction enzyme, S subunit
MTGEWREIRVGDLVDEGALSISDGYRVRNEELGSEGIPFVRGGDIGDGWINTDTEDHIRPELADRVQEKLTKAEDAAFITKGTVGRAGWLRPAQPPVVFAPQVAYWRVTNRAVLHPRFIFYLMRSHEFQSALDGVKTHGAMAADYVSISQQHDFRFRFPSIETQRAIAHILGTLDDKIELNRRMSETLEAMARALFKSWFVDFDPVRAKVEGRDPGLPKPIADLFPACVVDSDLGEIPEGWEVRPLGDLLEFTYGKALKAEDRHDGQIPVYGSNGQIGWHNERLAAGPGVVVGRKGNPGVVTWAATDFFAIDTAFYVVPKSSCLSLHFLFHALRSHELASLSADSAVPGLNRNLAYMSLQSLPSQSVLERFEGIAQSLARRVHRLGEETRTLAAMRDTLLPKLISGEVRALNGGLFAGRSG